MTSTHVPLFSQGPSWHKPISAKKTLFQHHHPTFVLHCCSFVNGIIWIRLMNYYLYLTHDAEFQHLINRSKSWHRGTYCIPLTVWTISTDEFQHTLTLVVVDEIDTGSIVLTWSVSTSINIYIWFYSILQCSAINESTFLLAAKVRFEARI
jgi:hypothetical protein